MVIGLAVIGLLLVILVLREPPPMSDRELPLWVDGGPSFIMQQSAAVGGKPTVAPDFFPVV